MKTHYILFTTAFLAFFTSIDVFSQVYCIPPESGFGGPMTGFTNVTLNTLNNTTANDGYTDYTGSVAAVTLQKGNSYTPSFVLYHDVLNQGFTDKMNLRIWIDYNIDGDFEDVGEEVFSMQTPQLLTPTNNNVTGTPFIISNNATVGTTRMRVYSDMLEADGHDTPIPCGYLNSQNQLGQHGETEDYKVTITASNSIEELQSINNFLVYAKNQYSVNAQFNLFQPGNVTLEVYSITGQKENIILSEKLNAGLHNIEFLTSDLSVGIYFFRLQVDKSGVYTQKVVIK